VALETPARDPRFSESGTFTAEFVRAVEDALSARDKDRVRALALDLAEADQADLIELLPEEDRGALIAALGADFEPDVLAELEPEVRDQIVEQLSNTQIAEAVRELETDDAVYLLENMEREDKEEVLAQLPADERTAIEKSLTYPEESAGRLMQVELIAVPPTWTVGQVIDHMRESDDLPDSFEAVHVVDKDFRLIGTVSLDRLLRTKRPVPVEQIMERDVNPVLATADQEQVARQFERFNLVSAPVVDADQKLVGVVTVDDVVEVIREEAEEDIKLLGGVGDESLADRVLTTVRQRFVWLVFNLVTAFLASSVIKLFDATIEQMVALAVLMPIVASMGGNAGTQTMTVTVRALAMRELGPVNAMRVILREASVGLINGFLFAIIVGTITLLWFGVTKLGLVIGAALIVNFLVAAIGGILIPMALDRLKQDPAVASGVFVTMLTDTVGFFAFLGLAALWLM
jgi:magnesium transporter